MIKVVPISIQKQTHSCDNCSRIMPLILKYSFIDSKSKEFNVLHLCEDCSNALANLHYKSMVNVEPFKYDLDEISKIEEE